MTNKTDAAAFAEYLQSMVKIDSLDKMTQNLEQELADSQRVMKDIKSMFESIPTSQSPTEDSANNGPRHEDLSKFIDATVPMLLLPNMDEKYMENVDLDQVISSMKAYAEELKKNIPATSQQPNLAQKNIDNLNLEHYATSLDQLSKRLANIKLSKKNTLDDRNPELEAKLSQLCQDVEMFTQVVQAKTALSGCNENWQTAPINNNALQYQEIVGKLLAGINEVSYLLQNNK